MRAVVVGAGGRIGRAFTANTPGTVGLTRERLDVTDRAAVEAIDWRRFDAIVNAAAFTAVDTAELPSSKARLEVNSAGAANLARVAERHGLLLVHFSSDYVLAGAGDTPVLETVGPGPLSEYGRSKASGDRAVEAHSPWHYIVRTSWVVGPGRNFVTDMATLARRGEHVTIVDDQRGRPTFADDLAEGVRTLMISGAAAGTYNVTNGGEPTTWAALARQVFEHFGRADHVTGRSTEAFMTEFPRKARRPLNSVLDLRKAAAVGVRLPRWEDQLKQYLTRL